MNNSESPRYDNVAFYIAANNKISFERVFSEYGTIVSL